MVSHERIDWARERAMAGSATQRSLCELAERAGWRVEPARGKGGHYLASRAGALRPVTIQSRIYRQMVLVVISQLEKGSAR